MVGSSLAYLTIEDIEVNMLSLFLKWQLFHRGLMNTCAFLPQHAREKLEVNSSIAKAFHLQMFLPQSLLHLKTPSSAAFDGTRICDISRWLHPIGIMFLSLRRMHVGWVKIQARHNKAVWICVSLSRTKPSTSPSLTPTHVHECANLERQMQAGCIDRVAWCGSSETKQVKIQTTYIHMSLLYEIQKSYGAAFFPTSPTSHFVVSCSCRGKFREDRTQITECPLAALQRAMLVSAPFSKIKNNIKQPI